MDSHNDFDEEKTIVFKSWAVDEKGKETHDPWAINHIVRDTTIPPKGHSKHEFIFTNKNNAKRINVDVKLNYRSATQHFAESLLGHDAPVIPTINMEQVSKTYVKQENGWREIIKYDF